MTAPSGDKARGESVRITEWLERDLGGRVARIERQARWRPAWWVDLERDGELLPLYVRGDRIKDAEKEAELLADPHTAKFVTPIHDKSDIEVKA